jgi:hypothetical protein
VSPLVQPVIGYAVEHGQDAAEEAVRRTFGNHVHADQGAIVTGRLDGLEQLVRHLCNATGVVLLILGGIVVHAAVQRLT